MTPELKLRIAFRMLSAPYGSRVAMARQLAADSGRSIRSMYRWRNRFQKGGYAALDRPRSDAGRPRVYSEDQLRAVVEVALDTRQGSICAQFRALNLPGSSETFRRWIWRVRRFGDSVLEVLSA